VQQWKVRQALEQRAGLFSRKPPRGIKASGPKREGRGTVPRPFSIVVLSFSPHSLRAQGFLRELAGTEEEQEEEEEDSKKKSPLQ
jgi:hypothetical protein